MNISTRHTSPKQDSIIRDDKVLSKAHTVKEAQMTAVSVIVPTYNEEEYLRQALDSLAQQTLKSIEIICVNDGSTDNSLAILQEYVNRYPQFRLIDKENGGYGCAVNTGIAASTGEYIGILEPDDFIDAHMFEDLYRYAQIDLLPSQDILPCAQSYLEQHPEQTKADIVRSSFYHYWDANEYEPATVTTPPSYRGLPYRVTLGTVPELALTVRDHPAVWACIYRREYLTQNNIHFIEARGAGWVDNPWLFDTALSAKTLVWVPKAYYHYRRTNENSSMFTTDYTIPLSRMEDMLAIFDRYPQADAQIYRHFTRRVLRLTVSIFNGMQLQKPDPQLFERVRKIFSRLKPKAVLENPEIEETRKIFYREVMGLYDKKLKKLERVKSPELTLLVNAHNNYAFISGILRLLNTQNSSAPIDIIAWDEGGSWDYSAIFSQHVASFDKRISYLNGNAHEVFAHIRTDKVYVVASNATLQKNSAEQLIAVTRQSSADILLVDSLNTLECPIGMSTIETIYPQLFELMPTNFGNFCIKTTLLSQVFDHLEKYPFDYDPSELMLRTLLTAHTLECSSLKCIRTLKRDRAMGAVRIAREQIKAENLRMDALVRMKTLLIEQGAYEAAEKSFEHFAAGVLIEDLRDDDFISFKFKARYIKDGYTAALLPHLEDQHEFIARSPEELLYLLKHNEPLYHKQMGLERYVTIRNQRNDYRERYYAERMQNTKIWQGINQKGLQGFSRFILKTPLGPILRNLLKH